jgi:predicted DNA-binding protein
MSSDARDLKTAAMSFRVEPELLEKFNAFAKRRGTPAAQLVRELMWKIVEMDEARRERQPMTNEWER